MNKNEYLSPECASISIDVIAPCNNSPGDYTDGTDQNSGWGTDPND